MNFPNVIFLVVTHLTVIYSTLPPIQKCKLSDSVCLKASAQAALTAMVAGIPELGTETLDVLHVDHIKVDLAGLKFDLRSADLKGLKKAVIEKLKVDMTKKQIVLVYHADMSLKGKYKASGRLLVLPISGDGDIEIALKTSQVEMIMPFDLTKNEFGKDVIELKSLKLKYDIKDGAHFHLTNLFNGNKVLSDTMLAFMNENWKLLSQEFGTPMFEKPHVKIFNAIKTYLRSQPLEDIAEY